MPNATEETNEELDLEKACVCYDCGEKLITDENKEILNGKLVAYMVKKEKIFVFKCNECFEKKIPFHFQDCEVYSRVVGYIRPVQSYHAGKVQEFDERKNFKLENYTKKA